MTEENLKKLIDQLFSKGMSFSSYPYRIIWLVSEEVKNYPAQVLITVSSKAMKRAVDRNKVKRQIREIYRYQKLKLYDYLNGKKHHALIGIIYSGSELLSFEEAQEKIILLMSRLLKDIKKQLER